MFSTQRGGALSRFVPFAIAAAAVLIRLAPILRADVSFAFRPGDTAEYLQLADGIRHGCGFARLVNGSCQAAEILRTPGYPLFLAMMPGIRWALVVQAILGGVVALLIAFCVKGRWTLAAAIAAEALVAFDLPSIVMSNELMSEALFQFAIVAALVAPLLAVSRLRNVLVAATLSGFVAGFAILTRPIGIVLPVLLPLAFLPTPSLKRRHRFLAGALAFAIPTCVVLGWSARNYELRGYFGLSTVGAVNTYWYRAANAVARHDGLLLAQTRASFGAQLGVPFQKIYDASVQSPELARRMNRLGVQVLWAHPVETAAMTLQGVIYLALSPIRTPLAAMLGTAGGSFEEGLNAGAPSISRIRNTLRTMLRSPVLSVLVVFEAALTLALWVGVVAAFLRCTRAKPEYRLWVFYLAAAGVLLLALAAGGEADARFRAPVIPLLAIVAALGYFPGSRLQEAQPAEVPGRVAMVA